jgi:hypothetical protein
MTRLSWLLLLAAVPPLAAQSSAADRAADLITEAEVRKRILLIADDSMGGRDTPSRGLELTAQYVAREFEQLGLKPGGPDGSYLQRYGITTRHIDGAASHLVVSTPNGTTTPLSLATDAALLFGSPAIGATTGDLVMVGGQIGKEDKLDASLVRGRGILFISDWSRGAPNGLNMVAAAVLTNQAKFAVIVVNGIKQFPGTGSAASLNQMTREGSEWFLTAVPEASVVAGIPDAAARFESIRNTAGLVVQPLDGWKATLSVTAQDDPTTRVPNAVGILEGTDPVLKNEYVVVSAHMDHVGTRCGGRTPADSICNGADDDASGTAGVLEIAKAFAAPGARPKRSMIFLVVSGEERGLWGSDAYAASPSVPIRQIVANLNMDQLGRNWKDTVVVIGTEHSDLGHTIQEVAARKADLNMIPAGDQWPAENIYYRSDHFNFARRGVPILFFTSGLHPDYHQVSDSPDKVDAEKEARILKLVYFVAQDVANRPERPRWNPESYATIVDPAFRTTP